jgi:hypothetical protein
LCRFGVVLEMVEELAADDVVERWLTCLHTVTQPAPCPLGRVLADPAEVRQLVEHANRAAGAIVAWVMGTGILSQG